jgi:hypothetical protein
MFISFIKSTLNHKPLKLYTLVCTGKIAKWTDGALPVPNSRNRSSSHSQHSLSIRPPTIPIFVEEQFSVEKEGKAVIDDEGKSKPGLSVRAKIEGCLVEKISKDPLARHKQKVNESTATENMDVIKSEQNASSNFKTFADSNPTTKGKSNSVASQGPQELAASTAECKVLDKVPFTVFSDEAPSKASDKVPFTIFSDEAPSKASDKVPFTVFSDEAPSKASDKVPFTVFSDEAPSKASDKVPFTVFSDKAPSKASDKVPFTVFSDEAPSKASDKVPVTVFSDKAPSKASDKVPFTIFSDEAPSKASDKVPFTVFSDEVPKSKSDVKRNETKRACTEFTIPTESLLTNVEHFDDKLTSKQSAPKPGFTIFVDDSCQKKVMRDVEENERNVLCTDKKVANSEFTMKSPFTKTRQQEEDDEVMAVLGILDNDDATINTKLAKVDIDAMFCSPGLSTTQRKTTKLQLQQTIGELSDIKEASGDCDRSIFGTIATPFMQSTTKTFDGELWASRIQKDDGPEIRSTLQFIPEDDAVEKITFPEKRYNYVQFRF